MRSTLVLCVLLAGVAEPPVVAAQTREPDFAPDWPTLLALHPGDKVRVWIRREALVTGILTAYYPPDSLSLERSLDLLHPRPPRQYDLYWIDVRRIDVPHGRDLLGGMLRGVGLAVTAGTFISLGCSAEGGGQCGIARWSVKAAPYTVPLGLVWGFFLTRWRRVY